MTNYQLKAQKRTLTGRKVKSLRRQGIVPANVFGKKSTSASIQAEVKALTDTLKKAGETSLVNLQIEGEKSPRSVLIAGYAQNPVTGELLHVDFHEVDLTQKTTATVPLKAVGESTAVKSGMVLVMQKNELEVEALPTDLPDHIEVDLSVLTEVGSSIHAKDLKFDRTKVTVEIGDDEVIATIQEPAKEEVLEPVAPADESAEASAKAEGEAPKEGEAKSDDTKPAPEAKKE